MWPRVDNKTCLLPISRPY